MKPSCLGRYILIDRIATGGMGEVFVAVVKNFWGSEKFFAVKRILPALSQDSEFLLRFKEEARLVIPMNHPNVVQVFEVGRADDEYFIAMELVEGLNIGNLLSKFWQLRHQCLLPVSAALFIVRELLAGLEYCHQHTDASGLRMGVVHRDVSPSNVLISYEGTIKLTDFGLALSTLKASKTNPRHLFGHLGYIAPERLDGREVDHRTDIYCAGILLFELLTCQRFASGHDPTVLRGLLRTRSQVRPSQIRGEVPPEVDLLVARAVATDPSCRFATAQHFLEAVQHQLIRLDPLYSAKKLQETVLEPVFKGSVQRRLLRKYVGQLDLEEIVADRPASRTVCIGEAIPIGSRPETTQSGKRRVLTVAGELNDGDTERMEQPCYPTVPVEPAAARGGKPAAISGRRGLSKWRLASPRRDKRANPQGDKSATDSGPLLDLFKRWIEVDSG